MFTVISLGSIMLVMIVQSLSSFINLRTISYQQVEMNLRANSAHLQDTIIVKFKEWADFIQYTALVAAPFMAEKPANTKELQRVFAQAVNVQTDISMIYGSGNQVWNQPGGYMIYDNGAIPVDTYDNTQRSWFTNAKAHPHEVVFSETFISASTGRYIISASTNVYDALNQDVGVISGNIAIDMLEALMDKHSTLPEQHTYLLNKQGLFITYPDQESLLKKDFFTESKLEAYRTEVLSSPSFFKIDKDTFIYSVFIPHVDWILVSTIPTSVIFTRVNRFMLELITTNGILVLIVLAMSLILIRLLQHEREENVAMKDNLKVGFFLMDRDYTIQGQYSHAMEQLFSAVDLKGKNFIGLLATSLTKKEINTLKDYFDLVFDRSFDQAMLDDINPIQELSYISVETGEEKILSCGFTPVNRAHNKVFVLGDILDITTEKKLQKQLAAEEAKQEEEMHFLFEVIQVEQQLLKDFIEDADYEFQQIDSVLKDQIITFKDAVVDIYQATHAIKSNAFILGLQTFGEQVHGLESKIKELREQKTILQEDMLHLMEGIEKIKEEKGKLVEIIQKIQAFKTERKWHQSEVLIESLTKACNRVSTDLHKKVRLAVERIDLQAIEKGPRRIIKEILMQLIRNAIYHGIESSEERQAQGKEETGTISLSIKREEEMIQLYLADDGGGIDFDKIRKKAEELHIVPEGQSGEEEDWLVQALFAPGFSTAEAEGVHAGRGIGLNLVRDRVQELGGTIQVHSEYHKGTAFTIVIPSLIPS
jgi:two-component system chemotaxis sensor kinase CheA